MQHNKFIIESELSDETRFLLQTDVLSTFPANMRCMFQKGKGSLWLPQDEAISVAAWVQLHLNDRHFVMVDFDGLDEFHWRTLPLTPNIVSFNPNNGNHQCYWLLQDPVHCQKASKRNKPYKYLRLLEKAIDLKYKGDVNFARAISKNLFHKKWDTEWIHDRRHTLTDIHKGLELDLRDTGYKMSLRPPVVHRKAKQANGKRNSTLFDTVRFRAYKEVAKYKAMTDIKYDDWLQKVIEWCHRENVWKDADPLPASEVEATAKQIAKFCWHVYKPRKPRMTKEQIKEAQRKAQKMTKAKQIGSTEAAIKEAIRQLKEDNKRVSKSAVSRMIGISRQNIYTRYSHLFTD